MSVGESRSILEEAAYWVAIYALILAKEEAVLRQVENEAATADHQIELAVMASQIGKSRQRLGFWKARMPGLS